MDVCVCGAPVAYISGRKLQDAFRPIHSIAPFASIPFIDSLHPVPSTPSIPSRPLSSIHSAHSILAHLDVQLVTCECFVDLMGLA